MALKGGGQGSEGLLSGRVWTTRTARFNAYRRLSETKTWVTRATSFASAYLVILAVYVSISPGQGNVPDERWSSFMIAALGIVVLVLTLLEHSRDHGLRAHRLHECAIELTSLYLRIKAVEDDPSANGKKLGELRDEYDACLMRYSDVNHSSTDYRRIRYQYPEDSGLNPCRAGVTNWLLKWKALWLYVLAVVVPPVGAVIYYAL